MGYLNPVFEDLLDEDEVRKIQGEGASRPLVGNTPEKPEERMESEPPAEVRQYPEIVIYDDTQRRYFVSAVQDEIRTVKLPETDGIIINKGEEKDKSSIAGNATETEVIADRNQGDIVKTLESPAHASQDTDEMDTFCLAKDSILFSQVSTNTLVTSNAKVEHVGSKPEADPCQVVEVKGILKSVVSSLEPIKHVVYPSRSIETMVRVWPPFR